MMKLLTLLTVAVFALAPQAEAGGAKHRHYHRSYVHHPAFCSGYGIHGYVGGTPGWSSTGGPPGIPGVTGY